MLERHTGDPLPPAYPVRYGRPPLADGDRIPVPPPPPPRRLAPGLIVAGIVLALVVAGIAGWWS